MLVEQRKWSKNENWKILSNHQLGDRANLVFVFGSTTLVQDQKRFDEIRTLYPKAEIVVSSGSGEILAGKVEQHTLNVTAIHFEKTQIKTLEINLADVKDSFDAGAHISAQIEKDNLSNLLIFSDGKEINGSHLLTGLQFNLSESVPITGGLAGSYDPFAATYTGLNTIGKTGKVIGIGFYGSHIQIGYASQSGWTPFGPERFITKSTNNILFELNEEPILDFYKKYLEGLFVNIEEAIRMFPLGIKAENGNERIMRSFLSYNPENGGAQFAGEMPEGIKVRMMRSNINSLLDSAEEAAKNSVIPFKSSPPDLALCVSCSGRQFILQDWIDQEVEAIVLGLGSPIPVTGFYSYGEIAPQAKNQKSELHNHTMTITTFKELA
ncbi:FIST C-terminal domain-containing protein [Reichenbachiella carrageenanivorans]|uniref:FIST C-terminal domain-containing protein n=1 Tax=Reichenbachiella carrageenanivorans TaxID=2979869 RepID=A0ABY6CXU4_9BACT|nr:FIST N-terminal domain-containing protein [Reichenbachiella carrageenanivorans]UXX78736.1 FIST C-terminal domain-containing protein [Reichenbachiella carrageenanivorans]